MLDILPGQAPNGRMLPHTRATVAAAAFAITSGKKVAGVYDHSSARDLRIAAEFRDNQLQGFDGDRNAKFGGTLPELFDTGDKAFLSVEIDGTTIRGYDRNTSTFYSARVDDGLVQIFDHSEDTWFAYDIQCAEADWRYHRGEPANR